MEEKDMVEQEKDNNQIIIDDSNIGIETLDDDISNVEKLEINDSEGKTKKKRKKRKNKEKSRKISPLINIGFFCSLCGIATFGITAVIGVICCIVGYTKCKRREGDGKERALAGIIIGSLLIIGFLVYFIEYDEFDFNDDDRSYNEIIDDIVDDYIEEKKEENKEETEEKETIYNIGDAVPCGNFEIIIESVSVRDTVGTEYYDITASDGGTYVCVDFWIKNISEEPKSSYSFPTIKLQNSKGINYSRDYDASVHYRYEKKDRDTKIVSDLNPGIKVKDYSAFEVAKEFYENDSWYVNIDDKAKVKIK